MASIPTNASRRDAGLVRDIGAFALSGTFIGMLVGSGIFTVPASMAAAVGSFAPLAYLGCALAVGAIMLCFAEGASRVPTAGGISGFVDAAFGPYPSFLTGVFTWMSVVLAAGAIAAAAADIIGTVVPALASGPTRAVALVGWFVMLALVNLRGAGFSARLTTVATGIKLVPLALFIAVGIWFIEPARLVLPLAAGSTDLGRAAILGIFMFTGIEGSLAVSGEVSNPARTIPRAIGFSMAIYAALCIAVQVIAQGLMGDALAGSVSPLADAIGAISPPLGLVLGAGAAVSMLGWTASDALSSPRLIFAMARDGFLPEPLGRLHPRTHTPWLASFAHAAAAGGLAISGSFTALASLSTLFCVLLYLIGSAAAVKLRVDGVARAGPPVRIPGLVPVAAAGCAAMIWVGAQSTPGEALAILLFIGVASLVYRFRRVVS